MDNKKPYIDFSFLGVSSFSELLTQAGTPYSLIDIPDISKIYEDENIFIIEGQDTITMGQATRDGKTLYFLELGIMIAQDINVRSYIVFIFNQLPEFKEIKDTINDIEPLINDYMSKNLEEGKTNNTPAKDKESLN